MNGNKDSISIDSTNVSSGKGLSDSNRENTERRKNKINCIFYKQFVKYFKIEEIRRSQYS